MEKTIKKPRINKEEQIKELIKKKAGDLFDRPTTASLRSDKVVELAQLISKL